MASIFHVDKSLIKAVDDETARELVARLCRAELRAQGLSESCVTWGGDQRAKDGGVDVRVACSKTLHSADYLPASNTVIQVKAEKFNPAKIPKEMAPKGVLRPAIVELAKTGGAYLIVSTKDDDSATFLGPRCDAICKCLLEHGLGESVLSDFYDSRRIADWVEQYPAIATWLREVVGRPLRGWRPYGPWAYGEEDANSEYLTDDSVRMFLPDGAEVEVAAAISRIRTDLVTPVSIRLVGLSGVGKTRLVQALFDEQVCSDVEAASSENVIYCDLADNPEPQPSAMLESLQEWDSDSVVIIDNCGAGTHAKLTEIINRSSNRLRLITVEYDIRDDLPTDTRCYRLEGVSADIIKRLLRSRYNLLSYSDIDRIADFSDGNIRVAFALGSAVKFGGELSELKDSVLFERLFVQKQGASEELMRAAEAASLLYSFDWEEDSGELGLLAGMADLSVTAFRRHMVELRRRGLLQCRGQWRAVLPHAISNGLAKRALESGSSEEFYRFLVENDSERVVRSFCRRLGYLHDCSEAVKIAERMLSAKGVLGGLSSFSALQLQLFTNLAPVAPRDALAVIERTVAIGDFKFNWDRIARVVRSIAYDEDMFDDAMAVLKAITLSTDSSSGQNSAREMFTSFFWRQLSGTQATPVQRHSVAMTLIQSDNNQERELGMIALKAGLKTSYFSSMHGFDFGARRRDYGWRPHSIDDLRSWYLPWINMLVAMCEKSSSLADNAWIIFGESFRQLWSVGFLADDLVSSVERLKSSGSCIEIWLGIRRSLKYDQDKMPIERLEALNALELSIRPTDLEGQIRSRILAKGNFVDDLEDEDLLNEELPLPERYSCRPVTAELLGVSVAEEPELLTSMLPDLCSGRGGSSYEFGRGIGLSYPNRSELFLKIKDQICELDSSKVNIIWIWGLINGWNQTDSCAVSMFLDSAVDDDVWRNWFVDLQDQVELDEQAFHRLVRALDPGMSPTCQFNNLRTDFLSVAQIMTLMYKLVSRGDDGLHAAIRELRMVVWRTDKKDSQYNADLGAALRMFLVNIVWPEMNRRGYSFVGENLDEVTEFAVKTVTSASDLEPLLEQILAVSDEDIYIHDSARKTALIPFFKHQPRFALEKVCVPAPDGTFHRAKKLTSDSRVNWEMHPVDFVPAEVFVDWCNGGADIRYKFAAEVCSLFKNDCRGDDRAIVLTETAILLLESVPDPVEIASIFVQRFYPSSWSGSYASLLESRLPLFDQLVAANESVRAEVDRAKVDLIRDIDRWREIERKEEQGRNLSFE